MKKTPDNKYLKKLGKAFMDLNLRIKWETNDKKVLKRIRRIEKNK